MDMQNQLLSKKVCLITGTSRGIGKAIATEYAKNGAIIYANARTEGCLDRFAQQMKDEHDAEVIPVYFDITDKCEMENTMIRIKKEQGRLDVLINNAGIMKDAIIGMISHRNIEEVFAVNVFAVIELIQFASKLMARQNSGSIINLSSIVGVNGNSGQMVYSASKGAVISLTKTAAKELASKNIRVNAIAPGMIDTDMFRSIGQAHMDERISNIGMKRLGTPQDVARVCVFLGSELSEYVTGQIIGVDGCALV